MLSEILPPGMRGQPPEPGDPKAQPGLCQPQPCPRGEPKGRADDHALQGAQNIARRVEQEGYCLVYLEVVDDTVAFARDDAVDRVPPWYVVYTQSEVEELYGKPEGVIISTFRLVHQAKKLGGQVVRRRNGSPGPPGPAWGGVP